MLNKRIKAAQSTAKRWVAQRGGNRIGQKTAAIYAKVLINEGKSGATAIDKAVKAGMRVSIKTRLQAI